MTQRTRLIVVIAAIALAIAVLAVALFMGPPAPEPSPTPTLTPTLDPTIYPPTPTRDPALSQEEYERQLEQLYLAAPRRDPLLSWEEAWEQHYQLVQELGPTAEAYETHEDYQVTGEIANPLFKRAFPDARMYWVETNENDEFLGYASYLLVRRGGRDYEMPGDFNQLMFDAGYELTEENRDLLAHALIIAALDP